ncbi:MAG: hypothetical protein QF535_20715 [Anaerolineales bacterium]|nr:hypothetical protein [Anaerolineales bacterium]
MLNSNAAIGKELHLTLPSSNLWGITSSTLVRCFLKWTTSNKLYKVQADATVTEDVGLTSDVITWTTSVELASDIMYEFIIEKRDSSNSMDNLGFDFSGFTSKQIISFDVGTSYGSSDEESGSVDIYPDSSSFSFTRSVSIDSNNI